MEEAHRAASERLGTLQEGDGRVVAERGRREAVWTTALAVLAWTGIERMEGKRNAALEFLLESRGRTTRRIKDSILGHDPSLVAWAWTEKSSPWVEPTALALLALGASGLGDHSRARQGREMLRDRQIGGGGWNYGNSKVFGQTLVPMPENTGLAVEAVAGHLGLGEVDGALAMLGNWLGSGGSTPLTLAHAVLGLSAWARRPQDSEVRIEESAERFAEGLGRNPALWGRLAVAYRARHGLVAWLRRAGDD